MSADPSEGAVQHPIRVAAARAGLTPAVLRAWERRYSAVSPGRSEGGQRLYSDTDVERLKLLARATSAGRAIGLVADLSTEELADLVAEDVEAVREAPVKVPPATDRSVPDVLRAAMATITELDAGRLRSILRQSALAMGVRSFVGSVTLPLLHRIGDAWHEGAITPAHEHMASAVIRELLAGLLADGAPAGSEGPLLVVATLSGERHELGAMAAAAAAGGEGWSVLYLGADLPAESVAAAVAQTGARAVAVGVVRSADGRAWTREFLALSKALDREAVLLVGGPAAVSLPKTGATVRRVEDLPSFITELRRIRASEVTG